MNLKLTPEQRRIIGEFPDDGTDWDGVHDEVMLKILADYVKARSWDNAEVNYFPQTENALKVLRQENEDFRKLDLKLIITELNQAYSYCNRDHPETRDILENMIGKFEKFQKSLKEIIK